MPDEQNVTAPVQTQPTSVPVEPSAPATATPQAPAVAPASPTPEAAAPPQVENKPKGKDAQARINELTSKYKFVADEVQQLREENQRLKGSAVANGPEGAAPAEPPENPYAPIGSGPNGEVTQDDLEGLPPAIRQMYNDFQGMKKEAAQQKRQSALEESLAKHYEDYPEVQGVADDASIALEISKRRLPLFNSDLVFAGRVVPILREKMTALEAENTALKAELHKDTVASPSNGSSAPAPEQQIDRQYAPGERMAAARRKATAKG
jgi:Tfp pilus assembly protein FimV